MAQKSCPLPRHLRDVLNNPREIRWPGSQSIRGGNGWM